VEEGGIGFGVQRDFLLTVFMEEEEEEEEVSSGTVRYCAGPGDVSECLHLEKVRVADLIKRRGRGW